MNEHDDDALAWIAQNFSVQTGHGSLVAMAAILTAGLLLLNSCTPRGTGGGTMGGTTAMGGTTGSGGMTGAGGTVSSTSGMHPTGGTTAMGGTTGSGGMTAVGGTVSSTSDMNPTGGTTAMGGTTGSGGMTGAGGSPAVNSSGPWTVDAGGYVTSGPWDGYAWTFASAGTGSTVSPADFSTLTAGSPLCASGSVGPMTDYSGSAGIGISLNQAQGTNTPLGTWTPTGTGIIINVSNPGGSPLRVQIQGPTGATDATDRWCTTLTTFDQSVSIRWSDFNTTCWNTTGSPYNMQPLQAVVLIVPGGNVAAVSFSACITSLSLQPGGGGTGGFVGSWKAKGDSCNTVIQGPPMLYVCPNGQLLMKGSANSGGITEVFTFCGLFTTSLPEWPMTDSHCSQDAGAVMGCFPKLDTCSWDAWDQQNTALSFFLETPQELAWVGAGCQGGGSGVVLFEPDTPDGGMTNDLCQASSCTPPSSMAVCNQPPPGTGGATGTNQCGTNCDCPGPCGVCESGQCRNAIQGPYGCTGGCSN